MNTRTTSNTQTIAAACESARLAELKRAAMRGIKAFFGQQEEWLCRTGIQALIEQIPEGWRSPEDDLALLMLDPRDAEANAVSEFLRGGGSGDRFEYGIVYHPSQTCSVVIARRANLEVVWRTLTTDQVCHFGRFPGWLPYDLPMVVVSSGGISMVGLGEPRD